MAHQLTFITRETYDSLQDGITIEAVLSLGEESFVCKVKVDPGAQVCLFKREIGEALGLNIESGHPRKLGTLTGTLLSYGHSVTLHTLGLEFDSVLYFSATPNLRRNLLGREGWLQKVRLAIVQSSNWQQREPRTHPARPCVFDCGRGEADFPPDAQFPLGH